MEYYDLFKLAFWLKPSIEIFSFILPVPDSTEINLQDQKNTFFLGVGSSHGGKKKVFQSCERIKLSILGKIH